MKYKKVLFLGSSVTYGSASNGISFVELLARKYKFDFIKEAVSGTTLVNDNDTSYVGRLKKIKDSNIDLFVCQLSTNDATLNKPLGNIDSSDEKTIIGAILTIIDYVKQKYNCPIYFYTNSYYKNDNYLKMVEALYNIKTIKDINIIDLYNDKLFNNISKKKRGKYMKDDIHPSLVGYRYWWLKKFDKIMR